MCLLRDDTDSFPVPASEVECATAMETLLSILLVVTVAYFDVRGGSGGNRGMVAVDATFELDTVEDTASGFSLPSPASFLFSLSLSLSVFSLCDVFPSTSLNKLPPSYDGYPF